MLSSKQRVLTALNNEQPDKVPIVNTIDWPIQVKLAEILGLAVGPESDSFRMIDLGCRLAEALEMDWVDSYHSTGQEPIIEMAAQIGIDVIGLEGDLASEENTMMSPEHYREFVKPYQLEIVEHTHRLGLKIFKHSDGSMWPILDDHMEVGFDGFHPIQPDCMDISEVKAHTAGKLCLIGNIDCRALLCDGSEEEVEATVKKTIAVAAPVGGYMLMSSNSIHPGVKPQNFIAMVRAGHKYGVYSL
jgi:uroporphyrinogen-III decarboxylase